MTSLTFSTAHFFNSKLCTVQGTVFQFFVILLVNAIEAIALKLNLCIAVTVYAPTHAKVGELVHLILFLYFAMAGLASYFTYIYVLRVVKINMVGQEVYTYPRYWLSLVYIPYFT